MHKRLYRSPKDGIILGIGSGLGHYFDKDPVIIRLAIVIVALIVKVWPMAILYGLMFLIIPVDPAQAKVSSAQEPRDVTRLEPESPDKTDESESAQEGNNEKQEEKRKDPTPVEHMDSGQNM